MSDKQMQRPASSARQTKKPPAALLYHRGPRIADEASLAAAIEALRLKDPEFVGRMLSAGGMPPLRRRDPGFAGLAAIIVSQQVSTASATAIFGRLEARYAPLGPAELMAATEDDLKRCGLSAPKIRALKAAAEAAADGRLDFDLLADVAAEEAHRALVAVKGVGPWTADVFLTLSLGHPDAFPAGDLALQEAARIALGLKARPEAGRLQRIAERWRPCRAVAARLLWSYYRAIKHRSGLALADGSR